MKLSGNGFTLVELMVVIGIIATLTAVSMPSLAKWMRSADYRSTARSIAQQLRLARSSAISQSLEHRIRFDVTNSRYVLEVGNRAANSSNWPAVATPIPGANAFSYPAIATMRYGVDCNSNASNQVISFNPNGTSNSLYLCVMEAASPTTRRWRVGVPLATTGRVVVER